MGNTYRASLSLRLNLERHVGRLRAEASQSHLLRGDKERPEEALARRRSQFGGRHSSGGPLIDRPAPAEETRAMSVLVFAANSAGNRQRQCQLKPFRFQWPVSVRRDEPASWTVEKTIEMKLLLTGASSNNNNNSLNTSREDSEPILLNVSWSPF